MSITSFMEENYRHFNARVTLEAARSYKAFVEDGGLMMVTLAGAMSTAEIGLTLADMIRKDKVHAISCTGANLEEDIFHLVACEHYRIIPHYRFLTLEDEEKLLKNHLNRVTDTTIPEEEAMRHIEKKIKRLWSEADVKNESYLPHEYFYQLIKSKVLEEDYQKDPKESWLVAACEKNLPIFVPGWEDSTMGNVFTAAILKGEVGSSRVIKSGVEYMLRLARWYQETSKKKKIGFFQIGGGIAGDFPICVVPMLEQDMKTKTPLWAYFCQISDSTTSYGSYSGATPNEKITWGKLSKNTPMYVIESDATIVAPLMFKYILGE